MAKKDDDELIIKSVEWAFDAFDAIIKAGGDPYYVLRDVPDQFLITMVRNNLKIKCEKPINEIR